MRAIVVMCVAALGCSSGPTTVLVRIGAGDAGPRPASLTVDVFGPRGRLAAANLTSPSLPGNLVLRGLADESQLVRVVVGSGGARGGGQVLTQAHAQVTLDVTPAAGRADGDGDGVPDELDDCPTVADPEQANAAGTGAGDACRMDAAANDLVGSDGGGGGLLCATSGLSFCDGFESGKIETHWNDNRQQGKASYAIDTTRAYRGAASLKLHHDAMAANDITEIGLGETQTFPAKDFFVRAFVYIPSPLTGAEEALLYARQTASPFEAFDVASDKDGYFVTYNSTNAQSIYTQSTTSMPVDRWVCLEWAVSARVLGNTHVWIDGNEVTALSVMQSLLDVPPISSVQFTLVAYKPGLAVPARDIWFDEVAVDTARIGCDR